MVSSCIEASHNNLGLDHAWRRHLCNGNVSLGFHPICPYSTTWHADEECIMIHSGDKEMILNDRCKGA
jgi:hypothetical protein